MASVAPTGLVAGAAGDVDPALDEDEELAQAEAETQQLEAWEKEHAANERAWEALEEDEDGRLRPAGELESQRRRRAAAADAARAARIRRGMLRYLCVVVDLSRATAETDYRPSRLAVLSGLLQSFVAAYFDLNPLSQMCVLATRHGIAELLSEMSSSPESHAAVLRAATDTGGDASLQNALFACLETLGHVPAYGTREVLLVQCALSTCDPGDIRDTIAACATAGLRCSVVALSAEVRVCRALCEATGGSFGVALGEAHLGELLSAHAPPTSTPVGAPTCLVRMGFPQRRPPPEGAGPPLPGWEGEYVCPQCKGRAASLPTECNLCGLQLVSSTQLARSYHHLFPVPPFEEVAPGGGGGAGDTTDRDCYACFAPFDAGRGAGRLRLACPKCGREFCAGCDLFIHEASAER